MARDNSLHGFATPKEDCATMEWLGNVIHLFILADMAVMDLSVGPCIVPDKFESSIPYCGQKSVQYLKFQNDIKGSKIDEIANCKLHLKGNHVYFYIRMIYFIKIVKT